MKRTLILSIAALLVQSAYAQIPKGAMAITGTIGFSGSKNLTEETTSNVTVTTWDQTTRGRLIMPGFSYFLSDKIEAGLAFMLQNSTTHNDYHPTNNFPSTLKERETTTPFNGFGIFGNYYFKNDKKFACYGVFNWAWAPEHPNQPTLTMQTLLPLLNRPPNPTPLVSTLVSCTSLGIIWP